MIRIERVYEFIDRDKPPSEYAVLVDRIWPRGVSKAALPMDEWAKDLGPSTALRKWFGHDPEKWNEFKDRYRAELESRQKELERLAAISKARTLTLLYSARDEEHNQAKALAEILERLPDR